MSCIKQDFPRTFAMGSKSLSKTSPGLGYQHLRHEELTKVEVDPWEMLAADTIFVKGAWSGFTCLIWRFMDFTQHTPPEIFLLLFQIQNNGFQTIKMYYLDSEQIPVFPEAMVLVKNLKIFSTFFLGKKAQKYCSLILQIEKERFSIKQCKSSNFSKGVSPWFKSKIGIFSIVCFWAKQSEKYCLLIFQIEKKAFFNVKIYFQKSGKIRIFATGLVHNHGLNPLQKFEFCHFFFKEIFMLKKAFFSVQSIGKQYFSAYFSQKQSMEKIPIFEKNYGLTPLQKFEFCHFFQKKIFMLKNTFFNIQNISEHYFSAYFAQKQTNF